MVSRAKIRKKYMQDKIMLTCLLHKDLDADIIRWLGMQENRSEAVRRALRDAMKKDNQAMCGECKHWQIEDAEYHIGNCNKFDDLMCAENGTDCKYFKRRKIKNDP